MRYENREIQKRIINKNKKEKILLSIIYICIVPIVFSYLFFIIQTIFEPDAEFSFFGIQQYTIISNSMNPTIQVNDLIFIKKCEENEIKKQDIITFECNGEIITHRIVKIDYINNERRFITKGDSNKVEDETYITFDKIKGKYIFKISKIGKIMLLLKRTDLFLLILIILFTAYLHERRMNKKRIRRHFERIEYEKNNKK